MAGGTSSKSREKALTHKGRAINELVVWRTTELHNFCVTFEEDDFCDVIYISGKKKGRGEENLFKKERRKGNRIPQN